MLQMEIRLELEKMRIEPGLCFFFGASLIPWRVLDRIPGTDRILVILSEAKESRKFHDQIISVSWEESSLRRWLNGEFFSRSFSGEEREAVVPYESPVMETGKKGKTAVRTIKDRVFLLSIAEANYYLKKDPIEVQLFDSIVQVESPEAPPEKEPFWLRPAGEGMNAPVFQKEADDRGFKVTDIKLVKPAMILDLGAPVFRKILKRDANGWPAFLKLSPYHLTGKTLDAVFGDQMFMVVPEGVEAIGESAFASREKLREISLPGSLKHVGANAFSFCRALERFRIKSRHVIYEGNTFANTDSLLPSEDLFRNREPLPEEFSRILLRDPDFFDPEALASILLFQEGNHWEDAVLSRLTPENAPLVARELFSLCAEEQMEPGSRRKAVSEVYRKAFSRYLLPGDREKYSSVLPEEDENLALTDGTVLRIPRLIEIKEGNSIPFGPGLHIVKVGTKTDNILVQVSDSFYMKRPAPLELRELAGSEGSVSYSKNQHRRISLSRGVFSGRLIEGQDGKRYLSWYAVASKLNGTEFGITSAAADLEELVLPKEIKKIWESSFRDCPNLRKLDWELEEPEFFRASLSDCPALRLPGKFFCKKEVIGTYYLPYIPEDCPEAIAYVLYFADRGNREGDEKIIGEKLSAENAPGVAEVLLRLLRESPGEGHYDKRAENLLRFALAAAPMLSGDEKREFLYAIRKSNRAGTRILDREAERDPGKEAVFSRYAFRTDIRILSDGAIRISPELPSFAEIMEAVGPYEEEGIRWEEFEREYYWRSPIRRCRMNKHPRADLLAKKLDRGDLMEFLEYFREKSSQWTAARRRPACRAFTVPYTVFAEEECVKEMLEKIRKDKVYSESREAREICEAVLLNDTAEAVEYAYRTDQLSWYAALRGMDEEIFRLRVCEIKNFTPVYGAAAVEKGRRILLRFLKADFLKKHMISPERFRETYLKNPLFRKHTESLLWASGNLRFAVAKDGSFRDPFGMPVRLPAEPVVLAHPMEMSRKECDLWKKYYETEGIRQPFPQLSEYVPEDYREGDLTYVFCLSDRYGKCRIPLTVTGELRRVGVSVEEDEVRYEDTRLALLSPLREDGYTWKKTGYEIREFSPPKYTRMVNHVVGIFDRLTVPSRILRDDVTIKQWLHFFSAEEIRQFVDLASKNKCTNVTSLLLEWQKEHEGAEADPMDIFEL